LKCGGVNLGSAPLRLGWGSQKGVGNNSREVRGGSFTSCYCGGYQRWYLTGQILEGAGLGRVVFGHGSEEGVGKGKGRNLSTRERGNSGKNGG